MKNFLGRAIARVNAMVDWFIPPTLQSSGALLPGVRMFLFSHLFGPFLGHTISMSMLLIQGGADLNWWIFFWAVTAFWPFVFVLRATGWYVTLSLVSIENLMFCIFWGCYNYGGINSPILPWLVTVPLLAFFYLPTRSTRIVVGLQIVVNLLIFCAIYATFGFPQTGEMSGLVALGMVSTLCAGVYVSMMALYYASIVSSQAELEQEVKRHEETQRRLRAATEQIERAMLAKSEFLAKMSHELRNPLNSIIGYSEVLMEGLDPANQQRHKDLMSIRRAGDRLLELINDLLDLSKLEAGKMELRDDAIDVRGLFDSVASNWRPIVERGGNKFLVRAPVGGEVRCDEHKLRRVVDNLLSNAAKFTNNGSVTFSASMETGSLVIAVADTGPGIANDEIGGLFETFGSAGDETDSNYGEDVRLGLPLAYRYCRIMGAQLSVRSEPGIGSTFTVRLPVARPAAQMPEAALPQAKAA